ncbi:MAG: MBG domain-containing protein, partial [Chitinophagaceae bacterium]
PPFTLTKTGFVKNNNGVELNDLGGAAAFESDALTLSEVGDYTITPVESNLHSKNYKFKFVNGKLTVVQRELTIKAENKTKTFGDINPSFTVTINGYAKNGQENVSDLSGEVDYETDALQFSNAGTYYIKPLVGNLSSKNYKFAFQNGSLAIGKKKLTVTAEDKSKIYGEANPGFTVAYNGFVNDGQQELNDLIDAPAFETDAAQFSDAGDYYIEPKTGDLQSNNYSFDFKRGKLEIRKKQLTITADNKTKIYGEGNPSFSVTMTGFVKNEGTELNDLGGAAAFETDAQTLSEVGEYTITPVESDLHSRNYAFNFISGKLNVVQRELTIKADNKSKTFGEVNPAFSVTINGYAQNGQTIVSDLNGDAEFETEAQQYSNAGTYTI